MIKIYVGKNCAYCGMVKKLLGYKKAEYQELDTEIQANLEEAYRISGGAMTVPITVINDQVIVGWNPQQLVSALNGTII